MSRRRCLAAADASRLASGLIAQGVRVYGPPSWDPASAALAATPHGYCRITEPVRLDLAAPMPALPLKALFLPPSEPLFTWRKEHNDVTLTPVALPLTPTVVLGARPCDAAAVAVLDRVMGWDYRDDFWFARREATTIVTIACDETPGSRSSATTMGCSAGFCETVGLARDSGKGSDVILRRQGDGYAAEALTGKGEALFEKCPECWKAPVHAATGEDAHPTPAATGEDAHPTPAATGGDAHSTPGATGGDAHPTPAVKEWLAAHFDDPLWTTLGLRCHGCGACASVCPTCHCFDIVDEPDGLLAGTRRRNWDTCQASRFTLHASGHNPRADQHARIRQRVLHKFFVYPARFGEVLCTGCGRCVEACPAGQDLREILAMVAERASS